MGPAEPGQNQRSSRALGSASSLLRRSTQLVTTHRLARVKETYRITPTMKYDWGFSENTAGDIISFGFAADLKPTSPFLSLSLSLPLSLSLTKAFRQLMTMTFSGLYLRMLLQKACSDFRGVSRSPSQGLRLGGCNLINQHREQ